jgi:hypothetical protein
MMNDLIEQWQAAAAAEREASVAWDRCDPADDREAEERYQRALERLIEGEDRLRAAVGQEYRMGPNEKAPCPVGATINGYPLVVSPDSTELPDGPPSWEE